MEIGTVQQVDIDEQMRAAYLDYAMSVIVARALPDARDGLKPVHRRILYAMQAVYDTMARMAQDFSMRYTLVDGQGNFGSIDGDAPAAMRYTEARLSPMAEEMLADINMNTVDFGDNFDSSLQEPQVLPARLPNLLLNGTSGIAVGMATNIPPHNLAELANAIHFIIENYARLDDITVEDLMKVLPGPDFPTGGIIVGTEGIISAYSTGRGRLVVRGQAHIEEMGRERHRIVITEIPFQLNKTSLLERIAELARGGRLDDVSDLRDESDRRGMSIIVEIKRGANPKKVLNQLYKFTPLQSTYGVQLLALVDGEPRLLSLKRALQVFIEHRRQVITRRTQFELDRARSRAHILEGLLIALANLDDVIQTIRQSPDVETARERLIERFKLSEAQAQAILDMQLRRLAALERQKIDDEHKQVLERIAYLEDLLEQPHKILGLIQDDLVELKESYSDPRRTRIAAEANESLNDEDLVQDEAVLISLTQRGYIKRIAADAFRSQNRGGRGVTGHTTREEDEVVMLFAARTLDTILFFSDRGKVYSEKAYQIPDAQRAGRGISILNVLAMDAGEKITAAVTVPDFQVAKFCSMTTRSGRIKRVPLVEFASVRLAGLIAISLDEGDELGWVRLTHGQDEIILVTEMGKALRFPENQVRSMGRMAAGVSGISLAKGDYVVGMEIVEADGDLMVVTTKGIGKRSSLSEYPTKSRARSGVVTINVKALGKIGKISAARVVQESDDLTLISANGVVLRTQVKDLQRSGRPTRGVVLMNLQGNDSLASLARIAAADLERAGAGD
jgi:DNA gyrase subunit A